VFGMEAMSQAASALTGRTDAPTLSDVEFLRPIVVPPNGSTTIRVAVLADGPDTVRAVIRSSDTGFQADHFRATLDYRAVLPDLGTVPLAGDRLPLDPAGQIYGPVLFQGMRFQRLIGYRDLAAKHTVAEIDNRARAPWFAPFLSADLMLGDPGTRDAMMHSIQCCVPDATLLPSGIEKLYLATPEAVAALDTVVLHGVERSRDGDTYVWDVDVRTTSGTLVERWEGLTLRAVRKQDGSGPWVPTLLGPYLERRTDTVLPAELRVAVRPDAEGEGRDVDARRRQTAETVGWLLGGEADLRYRPDGKPEAGGGFAVSSSHGAGVTFSVAATGTGVACDVETVEQRSEQDWSDLVGAEGFKLAGLVAGESKEDLAVAATRVWGAFEALSKSGRARADLTVDGSPRKDRWVVFRCGDARIATFPTVLSGSPAQVVFTMLADEKE
jgi:enediyne polyketide synthase